MKYERPEMFIINLNVEDVITSSGGTLENGGTGSDGELSMDQFT